MSERFAATVALYAVFCAAVLALGALAGRERGPMELACLIALEVALVVQVAGALAAVGGGERPADAATFGPYLVASIAVLPIGGTWLSDRRSRWDGVGLAVICLGLAVVAWRLLATWTG